MPLALEIDDIENVPETVRDFYVEKEDGGFALEVEGLPDVTGLKTALQKERKTAKELNRSLKAFEGIDPDEYQDLLNRKAELEGQDPEKIEQRIQERLKQNDQSWKERYEELNGTLAATTSELSTVRIDNELRKIGEALNVRSPAAMEDFVARGKSIYRLQDGKVVPVVDGEIIYGESGVEPLTMVEFGKKLVDTAAHLFQPSEGGGATNTGGSGKGGTGTVRTKGDLRSDADRAKYIGKHGMDAYLALPKAPSE